MEELIKEYFNDSCSENGNYTECSICGADGENNNLKKCICGKYFCMDCISEKKNQSCINDCFLFKDNEKITKSFYNISKYKLPQNFNVQIHFISVDWIRTGITFEKEIAEEKSDFNSPKYKIYYLLENMTELYCGENCEWLTYFPKGPSLKDEDYLNMQLLNGELKFFLNGEDLGKGYQINMTDKSYNDMYLLIHRRNTKSECEIVYIFDLGQ